MELSRKPLNPGEWLQSAPVEAWMGLIEEVPEAFVMPTPLQPEQKMSRVEKAMTHWMIANKGEGNREFWMLGVRLFHAGIDRWEAENYMRSAAASGRSPTERNRSIKTILNKLYSG